MGVEQDMSRLVGEFEKKKESGLSPDRMLRQMTQEQRLEGRTLEQMANDEGSLTYRLIKDNYPDLLERELLAAALEKKYISSESDFSKEYEAVYERDEKAIEQGHPSKEFADMQSQRFQVGDLVDYLTFMNNHEALVLEEHWQAEASREQMAQISENDRKEAMDTFQNYRILVPKQENPDESVELSLEEYVDFLAKKVLSPKHSMQGEELQTRVQHIRANLNFAIDPWKRKYILESYDEVLEPAVKEFRKWRLKDLQFELEDNDLAQMNEAFRKMQLESMKRALIAKILNG